MHEDHNALGVALGLRPTQPITLVRPHAAHRAARYFIEKFPGTSMYAVKANPSPDLIVALWDAGITTFDVASIAEVRLVRGLLPEASLCFMHPVKGEEAIAEAYHSHGVRTFSLDSEAELAKIVAATARDGVNATDLTLCVRLRVSSAHSKLSLASKFGVAAEDAGPLLVATRQVADALGICFHVGSQAMSPQAYAEALAQVRTAIVGAGVTVDVVDVGGGFPSVYPGMEPIALDAYFEVISRAFEALPVSYSAELWCEPGRALSAEYASVLVRVEARRDDVLYINDGAYGALFDAAHIHWRFPAKLVREGGSRARTMGFSFYGPTCDDMDFMRGPFELPADVRAGDYIELGMLGAYGSAMRTGFNGFTAGATIIARDEPMETVYGADEETPDNIVQLRQK